MVNIGVNPLSLDDVLEIVFRDAKVKLDESGVQKVETR